MRASHPLRWRYMRFLKDMSLSAALHAPLGNAGAKL